MVSAAHTLHAISDEKALSLFKTIAVSKSNTDILMTKLKLTRKQYYSRMKMLVDVGLVKRGSGKYYLTSFGRIAYEFYTRIQN
jgi:predicted transcriptional regulator